jgi:hypothetical protein
VAKERVSSKVDPETRRGAKAEAGERRAKLAAASDRAPVPVTAAELTPAKRSDGPAGVELAGTEPEGLEVLAVLSINS